MGILHGVFQRFRDSLIEQGAITRDPFREQIPAPPIVLPGGIEGALKDGSLVDVTQDSIKADNPPSLKVALTKKLWDAMHAPGWSAGGWGYSVRSSVFLHNAAHAAGIGEHTLGYATNFKLGYDPHTEIFKMDMIGEWMVVSFIWEEQAGTQTEPLPVPPATEKICPECGEHNRPDEIQCVCGYPFPA